MLIVATAYEQLVVYSKARQYNETAQLLQVRFSLSLSETP
jgi:hypothetical protein